MIYPKFHSIVVFALVIYYMAGFIDVVEGTNDYYPLLGMALTLVIIGTVGRSIIGRYGSLFIKTIGLLLLLVAGFGIGNKLGTFIASDPRMLLDGKYDNIRPNIISGCLLCVATAALFFYAVYAIVV